MLALTLLTARAAISLRHARARRRAPGAAAPGAAAAAAPAAAAAAAPAAALGDGRVAIDGGVYDVSRFARAHPGGEALLLRHTGCDASRAFRNYHPDRVYGMLPALYVGYGSALVRGVPGAAVVFAVYGSVEARLREDS